MLQRGLLVTSNTRDVLPTYQLPTHPIERALQMGFTREDSEENTRKVNAEHTRWIAIASK